MDIAKSLGVKTTTLAQAVSLARTDAAFLAALKTNAPEAISNKFGERPDSGLTVAEVEGSLVAMLGDQVLLSWKDNGDLEDTELEMVAGGSRTKLPD